MIRRITILGLAATLGLGAAGSSAALAADRVWFGGGVGLGFGDVDYVSVEPVVGFNVTSKISVGGGLIYRSTKDGRASPSFRTTDYGADVFTRYRVLGPVFLQAEYEHLRYEYSLGGAKERDDFDSVLAGAGFSTPLGGRASFFALALYNFSYDAEDLQSPYADAWSYRAGVSFGF